MNFWSNPGRSLKKIGRTAIRNPLAVMNPMTYIMSGAQLGGLGANVGNLFGGNLNEMAAADALGSAAVVGGALAGGAALAAPATGSLYAGSTLTPEVAFGTEALAPGFSTAPYLTPEVAAGSGSFGVPPLSAETVFAPESLFSSDKLGQSLKLANSLVNKEGGGGQQQPQQPPAGSRGAADPALLAMVMSQPEFLYPQRFYGKRSSLYA